MDRPQPPEARPAGVEGQVRTGQQPGDPVADEHAEHGPDHRQHDADLGRIVVVVVEPFFRGLGRIISGDDEKDPAIAATMTRAPCAPERIIAAGNGHRQSANGESEQDDQSNLTLIFCKLADHGTRSPEHPATVILILTGLRLLAQTQKLGQRLTERSSAQ